MTDRALSIGLVAHDAMKQILVDWVGNHKTQLQDCQLYATGTTTRALKAAHTDLNVTGLTSGPLGGDQQLGAMISEGKLDVLIFFQDPMTAQPHDVDVKALVRLSTLYDVALACNPATATLLMSSPKLGGLVQRNFEDHVRKWTDYLNRDVN